MQYCAFCGRGVPYDARFCGMCGHLTDIEQLQTGIEKQGIVSGTSLSPGSVDGFTVISQAPDEETMFRAQPQGSRPGASQTSLTQTALKGQNPFLPQAGSGLHGSKVSETQLAWTPPPAGSKVSETQLTWMPSHGQAEQDQQQCATIWAVPVLEAVAGGAWPSGTIPMVQGVPQVGSIPSVAGVPPALRHVKDAQHFHRSPLHRAAQSKIVIAVAVVTVTVLAILGPKIMASTPPTATLTPVASSSATPQDNLKLHGSDFVHDKYVTLKRVSLKQGKTYQIQVVAASQSTGTQTAFSPGLMAANIGALLQVPAPANNMVMASSSGTFDATVLIGADWQAGDYIQASEEGLPRPATMPVDMNSTPAPTPAPTSAPTSTPAPTKVIPPPAKLSVKPGKLDFQTMDIGQVAKQTVTVSNSGGQALDWKATLSGDAGWVTLDKKSGTIQAGDAAQKINVTVDTKYLDYGSYTATLDIHSNAGAAQVSITLLVSQTVSPAILSVSSNQLAFQAKDTNPPASQSVTVSNSGGQALDWRASSDVTWVTPYPASNTIQAGGAEQSVEVAVNTKDLSDGSYTATLTFSSNGGTAQVSITLVISHTTTKTTTSLCVLPAMLAFGTVAQGQQTTLPVTLMNCGSSTFTWHATSDSWITSDPGGPLAPGGTVVVNVAVDTSVLGDFQGSLNFITDTGETQSVPVSVSVLVKIDPGVTVTPGVTPDPGGVTPGPGVTVTPGVTPDPGGVTPGPGVIVTPGVTPPVLIG